MPKYEEWLKENEIGLSVLFIKNIVVDSSFDEFCKGIYLGLKAANGYFRTE